MVLGLQAFSQSELNEYKYIVVPKKFDGFRSENQYQTSTLIKYYFAQNGFNAVYDDALVPDLIKDQCLGLKVSLEDDSSMFATKVTIVLKDCQGNEVYRTGQGMSKVKEYNVAYREVISEAFNSFNGFRYEYIPKETKEAPVTISFKDDVKHLELGDNTKKEMIPAVNEVQPKVAAKPVEIADEAKETSAQMKNEVEDESLIVPKASEEVSKEKGTALVLYAQQTINGYQLVDTTPSVQYYLMETSMKDVYLADGKNKKGLVFLEDNQWVFEYYNGNKRIKEVLLIKF